MKRKALIVYGGWNGHEPDKVANIFKDVLIESDFQVELSDTLDAFLDLEKLKSLHLHLKQLHGLIHQILYHTPIHLRL